LFDNCTNSDFSWEEITGESKLENKDVFGNETEIMVDEAKSIGSLKTENCNEDEGQGYSSVGIFYCYK
jgi:hypothetical protein